MVSSLVCSFSGAIVCRAIGRVLGTRQLPGTSRLPGTRQLLDLPGTRDILELRASSGLSPPRCLESGLRVVPVRGPLRRVPAVLWVPRGGCSTARGVGATAGKQHECLMHRI